MFTSGKFWRGFVAFAALAGYGCGDDVKVELVASTIDFGETDCGTTAIPRVMLVSNDQDEAFHFTAELTAGADSKYTVVPSTGVVLPHSQTTVMIFSKPIPAESAVTENLYGETLIVTTDREDDTPHEVAITQTARGAVLEVSSTAVNFASEVTLGTHSELPFTIRNTGNAATIVSVEGDTASFSFVANPMIVAGGEAQGSLRFFPGHNRPHLEALSIRAQGPTCGTPTKVMASGRGTAGGIAAHALPGSSRLRPRSGAAQTLCVRTTTGVVACAGANDNGMRGATDEYLETYLPLFQGKGGGSDIGGFETADRLNVVQTEMGFLTDVVELVGGTGFYCARRQPGDVWCWGDYRGLGNRYQGTFGRNNPLAVKVVDADAVGIAAGYTYRCQIVGGNKALSCTTGRAASNSVDPSTWTLPNVGSTALHGGGGYAVLTDGSVMSFGLNQSGERGNADDELDPPSAVTGLTGITQVAAGGHGVNRATRFACARKDDGTAWCWGNNVHGQLGAGQRDGRGARQGRQTPVQVIDTSDAPLAGVSSVTAGRAHACAVISGSVSCWGRSTGVGSGNGEGVPRATPTDPALTNAVVVESGGTRATCAVLSTGALQCWGEFGNGIYPGPEAVPAFDP
ncbi:MAG: hypothetical protein SFX73_35970 [Kofleriaceae bacterium]|nr:hypothetical protein [Kofleriaceae bacterium]